MIIQNITHISDTFFNKKFANKYLGDQRTLRIGNIGSCISPVQITLNDKIYIGDKAINFLIELPDISSYAGACFQKLFVTNAANILAVKYLKTDIEIINNDIIIKQEHDNGGIKQLDGIVSINYIKNLDGTILIYLGLYNNAGPSSQARSYSLNFDIQTCHKFMDEVNESFYHLANSIFLTTAKM